MNRERLEKIIPKKKKIVTEEDFGYNDAIEDCLSALLENDVGVVPSVEEIAKLCGWEEGIKIGMHDYAHNVGCWNLASAIRTLMQGE